MAVLFTDLDSRDSNQIVAQLQATGVRHKVTKARHRLPFRFGLLQLELEKGALPGEALLACVKALEEGGAKAVASNHGHLLALHLPGFRSPDFQNMPFRYPFGVSCR